MLVANYQLPIAVIFTAQVVRWCVWAGLVALTVALLVMVRTSWGQSQPLRKCIGLSLLAHLLLGVYMTTVTIVLGTGGSPDGQSLRISYLDDGSDAADSPANFAPSAAGVNKPWEAFIPGPTAEPVEKTVTPAEIKQPAKEPERQTPVRQKPPTDPTPNNIVTPVEFSSSAIVPAPKPAAQSAEPIEAPTPRRDEPKHADIGPPETTPVEQDAAPEKTPKRSGDPAPQRSNSATAGGDDSDGKLVAIAKAPGIGAGVDVAPRKAVGATPIEGSGGTTGSNGAGDPTANRDLPSIYRLRTAGNRAGVVKGNGGSPDTEAAVRAALKWLAAGQSTDGRWDPRRYGAGRQVMIDGQDRRGAGSQADTGITGLALLAYLAAGHTHLEGEGQTTVRQGLEYLMRIQASNGNLSGQATTFEKMYCHAMATCALSEAYAMTKDDRLQVSVRRAIGYSVAAQHPASGGWRYAPGEPGDTSQLGWQLMALKSAELAGIKMPDETRAGINRYLRSVSGGRQGGLACYRPGHPISRPMTAEALVCRQFLGMTREDRAGDEAGNFLLEELPGNGEPNLYYWYYGTLGMFQLQGVHWQRWNEALQASLLHTQRTEGQLAGSWDPDSTWGAYGGRVYGTALSTLCLEVYYRFLPLYVEAAGRERNTR